MTNNKESKMHPIWRVVIHVSCMIVLVPLLIFATLRWIDSYTHHGEYITVPDVSGMFEDEAAELLKSNRLNYEVADYKFDKTFVEGGVIEQKPAPGAYVKQNRKVYLTLNSGKEPVKPIPDLADNSSLRAAESQLLAAGFKLSPTVYVNGAQDWVYEIRLNGVAMETGTNVPVGSVLTIVAGNGNVEPINHQDSSEVIVDTEFFEE